MNSSLLSKYQTLKYESPKTLFEPELWRAKEGYCPFCLCKLYEMKNKKFWYCRSKKHRNSFIISAEKIK